MTVDDRRDILVLGAGIVGAACAYHLAARGHRVRVLEADGPCAGATGACNGGLSYLGKTGADLEAAKDSLARYRELSKTLGRPVRIDQGRDVILLGKSEEDEGLLSSLVRTTRDAGLDAKLLQGDALRTYLPAAKRSVRAAAVASGGGQGVADPFSVTYAYLAAARTRGATLVRTRVRSLDVAGGVLRGVWTDQGPVAADAVVNCLGTEADAIWRDQGIDFGVVPVKGVVLVSDAWPRLFPGNLLNADFMKDDPPPVSLAIEQTISGNVLIGASKIAHDDTQDVPLHLLCRILDNARTYVQGLERLTIIRAFAGIRPHRDAGPFVDRTPLDGVFAAVGFGGTGITLAPWAGARMARLMEE